MNTDQIKKLAEEKKLRESAYKKDTYLSSTSRTVTIHENKMSDNKGRVVYNPNLKAANDFLGE
ncbi:MAG: hypothetical protein ABI855_02255 [Bacteroidota bacterium]